MRPVTLIAALLVGLGLVGVTQWRVHHHLAQADWLMARAQAHGEAYVRTFDGAQLQDELAVFKERRATLAVAQRWEQARALAVLLSALLTVALWAVWFHGRVEALRVHEAQRPPSEADLPEAPRGVAPSPEAVAAAITAALPAHVAMRL